MKINKMFLEKITDKKELLEYVYKLCVNVYVLVYIMASLVTMTSLFANQTIQTGSGYSLLLYTLLLVTYGSLIILKYNNKYNVFIYLILIQLLF